MNKEEYELLNKAVNMAGEPAYMGYRDLIELLRQVARAAKKIYDVDGDYVGDCTCTSCKKINENLRKALDAVPAWVLEE